MTKNEKYYVILTEFKEIFAGWSSDVSGEVIHLRDARQAVYFSADSKGLLGLGAIGPGKDSKISPPVAHLAVRKPANVIICSDSAIEKWEKAGWAK